MSNEIAMVFAGFLIFVCIADAWLTRDALKRSGGKIVEGNKLMVWFMKTDIRAVLVVVPEVALIYFLIHFLNIVGLWYVGVAFCLFFIVYRGKVVIGNYKLNVRIM